MYPALTKHHQQSPGQRNLIDRGSHVAACKYGMTTAPVSDLAGPRVFLMHSTQAARAAEEQKMSKEVLKLCNVRPGRPVSTYFISTTRLASRSASAPHFTTTTHINAILYYAILPFSTQHGERSDISVFTGGGGGKPRTICT